MKSLVLFFVLLSIYLIARVDANSFNETEALEGLLQDGAWNDSSNGTSSENRTSGGSIQCYQCEGPKCLFGLGVEKQTCGQGISTCLKVDCEGFTAAKQCNDRYPAAVVDTTISFQHQSRNCTANICKGNLCNRASIGSLGFFSVMSGFLTILMMTLKN